MTSRSVIFPQRSESFFSGSIFSNNDFFYTNQKYQRQTEPGRRNLGRRRGRPELRD